MTTKIYFVVFGQILLLVLLSSYQDMYRVQDSSAKYSGACGDLRYINTLFAGEKHISLSYNSSEKFDESEYRVSQVWRPKNPRGRKIVLTYMTCSFYETHNHAEGTWYLNSSHLILRKTSRIISLKRDLTKKDMNKFVFFSEALQLCCPHKIVRYKRPLRIAFYSSKIKIYDKILLNYPYLRVPGCDATGVDLIEWSILSPPRNRKHRQRPKASRNAAQYCTKYICFDEWIPELASADVFIFSLVPLPEWKFLRKLFPGQIWIGISGENWLRSPKYQYLRNEHDYWGIQLRSDWRMTADLPATFLSSTYFGSQNVDFYNDYSNFTLLKDRLKSVAVVLSNCGAPSGRDEIIMELSKYFPVVSYGKCYASLWPELKKQHNKAAGAYDLTFKQREALEKHMFAFAIPNVIEVDWVEEKIFSALHAGAIPIVFSNETANIQDFLPCNRCVVFVDHFSSLHKLSLHLENIANDKTLFAQYHEWRSNFDIKAYPGFEKAYKVSVDTLPCRVSEVLRPGSCPPSCALYQRGVTHSAVKRHSKLQRFW